MRESTPLLIKNAAEKPCAILLQASYCAEQEYGIKPILTTFGVDQRQPFNKLPSDYSGVMGLERLNTTKTSDKLKFVKIKESKTTFGQWMLYFHPYSKIPVTNKPSQGSIEIKDCTPKEFVESREFRGGLVQFSKKKVEKEGRYPSPESVASWDESGFCVITRNPEMGDFLEELHQSLETGTSAIWLGGAGNNPFARNGLALGILEKINKETLEETAKLEKEELLLQKDVEATGILNLIPENKYFALRAGRTLQSRISHGPIKTDFNVMFFLNPYDQHNHNFGWFTVEELRDWMQGKGPVFKTHEKSLENPDNGLAFSS
jgi:hypothetical protein